MIANTDNRPRECEGSEPTAFFERLIANAGDVGWKCEGPEHVRVSLRVRVRVRVSVCVRVSVRVSVRVRMSVRVCMCEGVCV